MKGSMRAAAAIGIGYVLGRHRKFRTAAVMAAGMTVGGTSVGNLAMKRGMKMLGSTDAIQKVAPQLGDLADTVRGDLVAAGKAAAAAAVSSRLDALTDSLHERAERVRNPAATVAEGAEEAAETGRTAARTGGRAADSEADEAEADDYQSDEYEDDEYEDDRTGDVDEDRADDVDEAPARRTTTRRRAPVSRAKG